MAVAYTQAMAIDVIEVMVEIPRGSRNKYEFDAARERYAGTPRGAH